MIRTRMMLQRCTLSPCTSSYTIPSVAFITQTNWPLFSGSLVKSWFTESVRTTRARIAQISWCKWSARNERISCMRFWTRANCFVANSFAVCVYAARWSPSLDIIRAWIHTPRPLALLFKSTIGLSQTLGLTTHCRFPYPTIWTFTNDIIASSTLTVGSWSARIRVARITACCAFSSKLIWQTMKNTNLCY